jgi:hypothetical protein
MIRTGPEGHAWANAERGMAAAIANKSANMNNRQGRHEGRIKFIRVPVAGLKKMLRRPPD